MKICAHSGDKMRCPAAGLGKTIRSQPGARHLVEHKSRRKTRRLATDQVLETADVKRVKRLLGK